MLTVETWSDSTRAFPQGQDDQGDRPGPKGVPEHGPQGPAIGSDFVRVSTRGPAETEAGPMDSGTRRVVDEQCSEGCSRAHDADPGLRGTTRARLRRRLRCRAALRQAMGKERGQSSAAAYVPLSFAPGEA